MSKDNKVREYMFQIAKNITLIEDCLIDRDFMSTVDTALIHEIYELLPQMRRLKSKYINVVARDLINK